MNSPGRTTTLHLPVELRGLGRVLLEKRWIILGCAGAALLAGSVLLVRSPQIYAATTTIEVEEEKKTVVKIDPNTAVGEAHEEVLKTIEQNLESPTVLLRLAKDPALRNDPAFLAGVPETATDGQLQRALGAKISVATRRGTHLIDIQAEDENPELAQKLADQVVREFLSLRAESRAEVSQGAHEYLRAEAERLKAALEKSEQNLQAYKEQHRAVSLEEKQNIVVEKLKELNAKVTTARMERLRLEADRARLAEATPEQLLALPSVASADEVARLKRTISEKETELAALSRRYKSEHPRHVQVTAELAGLRTGMDEAITKAAAMVGSAFETAQTTEESLAQALRDQETTALELSQMAIPYHALAREVESHRALYDSLLARLKESEVAQAVAPYAVHVVAPALLPDRPVRPNKRAILALSLCGGLALGLTIAFGAHAVDNTLRTLDHAEQVLGLRALAAVPLRRKPAEAAPRLLLNSRGSAVAEAFRACRTAVFLADKDHVPRSILFTSAVPGEGKSFCAVNFAVALAQQGLRTLIIDADLRLPSIGRMLLDFEDAPGLTEVLAGKCQLAAALHPTEIENLSVLPAGKLASNPAELIIRTPLALLLLPALEKFDRIVIDTAPVHAVSETLLLAPHADAVCVVVRAAKTPIPAVTRAVLRLRESGANLVGFLLNGVPTGHGGYYYHYQAAGYGRDEVYGGSAMAER